MLRIRGAKAHNLKDVTGGYSARHLHLRVTGVSGGGKSTLVVETLYKAAASGSRRA